MPRFNTTLQFPDIRSLWRFAQNLECAALEINTSNRTLVCVCLDQELEVALSEYHAAILQVAEQGTEPFPFTNGDRMDTQESARP